MPRKLKINAFSRAARIIHEATRVGFQWKNWFGPLQKVREELCELEHEIKLFSKARGLALSKDKTHLSNEIGDLIFSVCNLASLLGLNPEDSLNSTLDRFQSRFKFVKSELKKKGKTPEQSNLKEMNALWQKAKKRLQ